MTWHEISQLKNKTNGSRVLTLEEVLKHCQGKIAVMIDNKINGSDSTLFTRLVTLLKRYGRAGEALTVGTDESTGQTTGRKHAKTRLQLR